MKVLLNRLKSTENLAAAAITAALYVALTYILAPVGFSMVQFRFSEVMCLLAFIDPIYGVGITVGCFFANMASPYGLLDVAIGTCATLLSAIFISKSKNLFTATLWPTVFSLPVAGMISYSTGVSFWITAACLCLSEFVVVTVVGYPIFRYILNNQRIYSLLSLKRHAVEH